MNSIEPALTIKFLTVKLVTIELLTIELLRQKPYSDFHRGQLLTYL